MRKTGYALFLLLALALGFYTRFTGLSRGTSDFVSPEESRQGLRTAFYHFHPDEETLVRASLELGDPFAPPLTAYGMLPLYLLRGVLEVSALILGWDPAAFDEAETAHPVYVTVRLLSVLLSCASLGLVWLLGVRLFGLWPAGLALCFTAAAPVAVQLAHFATVDGLFTFLCLVVFCALVRALDTGRWGWYVLAGALVGAAGAVRLSGLLLGPVLLAGHLIRARGLAGLRPPGLWLAGLAAVLVLLLLQPFLAADPSLLWRAESTDDLGFSLKVAQGEILRPWTVADVHTTPYLHYWTHLLPLAVGWPLTLAFLLGVGHALWQRQPGSGLLLLWCLLYFAQIGGLHTKHVRYLLPLLPFLCLLTADALARLAGAPRWRPLGYALSALLVLYTGVYGLAFASVYTREDSRVQAGRWMGIHVPAGSRIGVERGGFSMSNLIDGEGHAIRQLNTTTLFAAGGYMTCRAVLVYLRGRLQDVDYLAITDVNRYQQFTAAPDLFPAAAAFYRTLLDGDMGFDLVRRFKNYPSLGWIEFRDDGAEPSFIGYDHPAVYVLERRDAAAVEQALERLEQELETDPHCPDRLLRQAAAALRTADLDRTADLVHQAGKQYPHLALAHLLAAEVHRRAGRPEEAQAARERYQSASLHRAAHVLPWAAGMGLVDLELPELAEGVLTEGALKAPHFPSWAARDMARAYVLLANHAYDRGQRDTAWIAYQLSAQIHPNVPAFNRLAFLAYRGQDYALAVEFWSRSVRLQDDQAGIHSNLGQVAAQHLRDYEQALYHLRRAVQLDPGLQAELSDWITAVQESIFGRGGTEGVLTEQ